MSGGLLGTLGDLGITVAVDPAMPDGVVEVRTTPGEPGIVLIMPGTPAEQRAREQALITRVREQARAGRHVPWSNDAQATLDRLTKPEEDDTP